MKHLIDAREPITTADIDQAIRDAVELLDELASREFPNGTFLADSRGVIERLLAIAEDTYGPPGED